MPDTKERDAKCVLALANSGKPKRTLERFTEAEKDALAAVWENSGEKPSLEFAAAYGEFWAVHSERWAEYLAANKAAVDDETDTEVVDE